ncbi:MAG: UvrB/UvrC motif-containing protein [Paenisporosarcina sp.]|nr:UvrB/UvrC motif-containing protein [Paenisporosarcina sp.]
MICENCKQRPAKVTVTQVHNGAQVQRHYCDVCAQEFHPYHLDFQQDALSLHQLLSNWFGSTETKQPQEKTQPELNTCSYCGWTFQQFLNQGKFGCAECYESFHGQLPEVFKKLHNGNVKHIGKAPGSFGQTLQLKKQIESIRTEMRTAIEIENFEEAARLRDEARALEEQLQSGGENRK